MTFGPAGFEPYPRLRFLPDPTYPGQSENDVPTITAKITTRGPSSLCSTRSWPRTPAPLTTATSACGKASAISTRRCPPVLRSSQRRLANVAASDARLLPPVLDAPKVVVHDRKYLLSQGALAGAGDWGAADMWPGHPRGTCRPPSSGSPIMPGASPTTSTHTGQGSGRTRTSSISSLPSHGWMESVPTQVTSSRHSTEEPRPAVEDCSSSIGHPGEARPSCTNQSASPTPRRVEPRSPTVSQPRRRTVGRVFAATHGESCRSVEFSERDAGTSCPLAAIYSRAAQ